VNLRESINDAEPMVMHIDLNSCFATVEQQARVRLRGRPLAVVNRLAGDAMVITASYEAKTHGVKTGMRISDAKRLCRGLVVTETDPPKYRYVYHKLLQLLVNAIYTQGGVNDGVLSINGTNRRCHCKPKR
jgi:DNA polymerase-4